MKHLSKTPFCLVALLTQLSRRAFSKKQVWIIPFILMAHAAFAQITVAPPTQKTRTTSEDVAINVTTGPNTTANLLNGVTTVTPGGTLSVTSFTVNGTTTPAGSTFSITGVGNITINADGTYNFSPALDYNGPVPVITVTITDGTVTNSNRTLAITLTAVNDTPELHTPSPTVPEDGVLRFGPSNPTGPILTDVDTGNGLYTYSIFLISTAGPTPQPADPTRGSITAANGPGITVAGSGTDSITLTGTLADINAYMADVATQPVYVQPAADLNITCFTLRYTTTVSDNGNTGSGGPRTDRQVRIITIQAVSDMFNYAVNACASQPVSFNVLTATGTVNGQPANFETTLGVSITAINGAAYTNPVALTNGQLTISANGDITFTPNAGFTGTQAFTYTAQPGGGCAETRTVTMNVQAAPVTPVLSLVQPTCTNANGSITITAPTGSGLTYSIDSVTYQSGTGFANVAPGTYNVTVKNSSGCIAATQAVINAADCIPVAVNDAATTPVNTPVNSNMATNDTCGNAACTYNTTPATAPVNGAVTINTNGTYTYTPATGFTGTDSFRYVLCDADDDCDTAMVVITIEAPLPVTIKAFRAIGKDRMVMLTWTTARESNCRGFAIERSTDGRSWSNIAFVPGKARNGNSIYELEYSYEDQSPVTGDNFYRLKQLDLDGNYSHSAVRMVKFAVGDFISVYPNPARHSVTISGLCGNESILLTDVAGRVVKRVQYMGAETVIDISSLSEGMYQLKIVSGSKIHLRKIIKLKN